MLRVGFVGPLSSMTVDHVRSFHRSSILPGASTLIAVGVDYQPKDYVLKDGDEVSLFPPVQGG